MNKTTPFVRLFSTPKGYYCYDVNTSSMLEISKEIYSTLKNKNKPVNQANKIVIDKLVKRGFLSNHRPNEMRHPYTDIIEEYLAHNVKKLTLQVTQNCNLSCKYCAYANPIEGRQRHHTNKSISSSIAKKGIDFLFSHSANEELVNIGFYGGEPLLEFSKVKSLINYADDLAEKHSKNISYSLTTNATLFTDEIIEYFIKHNIHILISLDGPKEIHDKNRIYRKTGKGSFTDVINNLEYIKEKYPEFVEQISINSVIDPENEFTCYNEFLTSYESIKDLRVNTNVINTSLISTSYDYNKMFIMQYQYEKFKLFLSLLGIIKTECVSGAMDLHSYNLSEMGKSFRDISILRDSMHHGGPCVAGAARLFMDVNGEFFPCERCSETSSVMNIGNINDGFDFDAIKKLINIGDLTEMECLDCWNIKHCTICATRAENKTVLSKSKKLKSCITSKKHTKNLMYDYLMLQEYGYDYNQNSM